ncbi:MAG: hypothetical protein KAG97_01110 [Victivallales bacterium]|nr:hypothetical protein [Victivallales bacterium]
MIDKQSVKVVAIGDSMSDTFGEGIPLSTNITPVDEIHPGDTGHQLIASVIVDAIKNAGIVK